MRGCNFCGALFDEKNDLETLKKLKEHQKKCNEDSLFINDGNAIKYEK